MTGTITERVAQLWCKPEHSNKQMDVEMATKHMSPDAYHSLVRSQLTEIYNLKLKITCLEMELEETKRTFGKDVLKMYQETLKSIHKDISE